VAGAATPAAQRDALRSVDAQALRISRLTADLRKLAELETRALELTQVDVAELLQQVVNLAQERPEDAERHLTLTLPRAPWPLPAVSADRDLLLLAVHNLVDNAIKYSEAGKTVEVGARIEDRSAIITVKDQGFGIAKEHLSRVFERFYRVDKARSRKLGGTGLGLAIVKHIAKVHHGEVRVESQPNEGSLFSLVIPANRDSQSPNA